MSKDKAISMGSVFSSWRSSAIFGWIVCLLAAVFYCYEYLLRIIPSVLRLKLIVPLHLGGAYMPAFGWLATAYLIGYTPLQLFVGYWTDRFGSRRVLVFALVLCVLGSFVFMYSHDLYTAMLGRVFVGAGSAFAFVAVLRLASIWLQPKYFSFFIGLTTALGMIGAAYGYTIMHHLVEVGQDWTFVVKCSAYFGCILIPVFLILIHEKSTVSSSSETALEERVELNSKSFLATTRELLLRREVIVSGLIGGILFLSLAVMADNLAPAFVKIDLQGIKGVTDLQILKVSRAIYFGWLFGAPLAGWFTEYLKTRRMILMWGILLATLTFVIILTLPIHQPIVLEVLLFLFGLFSSVEILCFTVVRDQVPLKNIAMAMGVVNFMVMLVSTCVMPLLTRLLDVFWSGGYQSLTGATVKLYSLHAYHIALSLVPVLYAIAFLLVCWLAESYPRIGRK